MKPLRGHRTLCTVQLLFALFSSAIFSRAEPPASTASQVEQFKKARYFFEQLSIGKRLIFSGDKSLALEFAPWLQLDDRHCRLNAAFVMASLGDDRGFDAICAAADDHSTRKSRPGYSGNQTVNAQIREDRYYAIHLLGELADRRAVPLLLPLLADDDVRYVVPWALERIGDPLAIPPLIEQLKSKDPDRRMLAILALGSLTARDAIPQLRNLANDKEACHFDKMTTVGEAARVALAALTPPVEGLRCWSAPDGQMALRYDPGQPLAEPGSPQRPGNFTLFHDDKPVWSWERWSDQSAHDAKAVWSGSNSGELLILDRPNRAETGMYLLHLGRPVKSEQLPLAELQQKVLQDDHDTDSRYLTKAWFGPWRCEGVFVGEYTVTKRRTHRLLLQLDARSSPSQLQVLDHRIEATPGNSRTGR